MATASCPTRRHLGLRGADRPSPKRVTATFLWRRGDVGAGHARRRLLSTNGVSGGTCVAGDVANRIRPTQLCRRLEGSLPICSRLAPRFRGRVRRPLGVGLRSAASDRGQRLRGGTGRPALDPRPTWCHRHGCVERRLQPVHWRPKSHVRQSGRQDRRTIRAALDGRCSENPCCCRTRRAGPGLDQRGSENLAICNSLSTPPPRRLLPTACTQQTTRRDTRTPIYNNWACESGANAVNRRWQLGQQTMSPSALPGYGLVGQSLPCSWPDHPFTIGAPRGGVTAEDPDNRIPHVVVVIGSDPPDRDDDCVRGAMIEISAAMTGHEERVVAGECKLRRSARAQAFSASSGVQREPRAAAVVLAPA